MKPLYEIFSGEELKIAELIQRRRYQMLVHSYIYYELNDNIISDNTWSTWAMELVELQTKYLHIAEKVTYAEDFADWDGSSGAFLTYANKPNIRATAEMLLENHSGRITVKVQLPIPTKPIELKQKTPRKKLF